MSVPVDRLFWETVREIRSRKWLMFLIFVATSFAVLITGMLWPQYYESSATIFVDEQNIIRPLMEGQAVATRAKVDDRAQAAAQLIHSRRVLEPLIKSGLWPELELTPENIDAKFRGLRKALSVRNRGRNFIQITYSDVNPETAYAVVRETVQQFLLESDATKRAESNSAYQFIDKQVKGYQEQLKASELRLKDFLAENADGTEAEVQRKLADLRNQIETTVLELEEANTAKQSIESQLLGVSQVINRGATESEFKKKIAVLQAQLETLRLSYHDTYPDIVNLKLQIKELERRASQVGSDDAEAAIVVENPIYQDLKSQLAQNNTRISTLNTRKASLERLNEVELARMQKIQENKAKLAELTRDNEVNKNIYDDLLRRREKARVSMRLDIEGQGINYEIHEPANLPVSPEGFKFELFAMSGLVLGAIAPIGLVVGLLQLDPRVRSASQIERQLGIEVITIIPRVENSLEQRENRCQTVRLIIAALAVVSIYISLSAAYMAGLIA